MTEDIDIPAMKSLQDTYTRDLAARDAEIERLSLAFTDSNRKLRETRAERDTLQQERNHAERHRNVLVAERDTLQQRVKKLTKAYNYETHVSARVPALEQRVRELEHDLHQARLGRMQDDEDELTSLRHQVERLREALNEIDANPWVKGDAGGVQSIVRQALKEIEKAPDMADVDPSLTNPVVEQVWP